MPMLAVPAIMATLAVSATTAYVIASVGIALALTAASVGIQYLLRPDAPTAPRQKPSQAQQELEQSVPPREWLYGRGKKSGSLAFYAVDGYDLFKVVILAHEEIDGVEEIYFDEVKVTTDSAGIVTHPYHFSTFDEFGLTYWAEVHAHFGSDGQTACTVLNAAFPGWTSGHRGRGVAYLMASFSSPEAEIYQKVFPNGEPTVSALFRGRKLYDPRNDTTAGGSGTHRIADKATWEWSDNAGLAVLDWLHHPDGYARPAARLDLTSFRTFANLCDQAVPLAAGGTEKRYRVSTIVNLRDERRPDVLRRLLQACDATLTLTAEGKIAIRGGQWTAPTVTLDADLGQILDPSFSTGVSALNRANEFALQFLSPEAGYIEDEAESWVDTADYAATGELRSKPVDLTQVPSSGQARRLAKIMMGRENPKWVGELRTNLYGLDLIGERTFTMKYPELGIDGPFWVDGEPRLTEDGTGVVVPFRSAVAASYDWNAATEEKRNPAPDKIDTPDQVYPAPAGLTLTQDATDPFFVATWSAVPGRVPYEMRYRKTGTTRWTTIKAPAGQEEAETGLLKVGVGYEAQVRALYSAQAVSDWSAAVTATVT